MFASSPNWITRNAPSLEPFGKLALLGALTAIPAMLAIWMFEPEIVLPALSLVLFAEAAIVAIAAYLVQARENAARFTLWDLAGAFTLMGCAAAILGEPDQAALFFEGQGAQRSD